MSTPARSVNAWIFLGEDEPPGTSYKSPNSDYQTLITYGVYDYCDMVNICFANTVPIPVPAGAPPSYTIALQSASHPAPYTNQDYMNFLIQDARAVNPNIKILITLGYAANEFTQIFSGTDPNQWKVQAASYANNVLTYLQANNLDGFDIDWEGSFSSSTPKDKMSLVLQALRTAFNTPSKTYLLTLSPAVAQNLDGTVVNSTVDFLNLQLYSGFTTEKEFIQAGINKNLLAYGAKFEVNGTVPYQNAQNAYQQATSGGYTIITQWRLNSNDYQFEQAQQMILYQLVYGIQGTSFNDTPIIGAAGNPPITQMVIRSGDVLNAIQATNTGSFQGTAVQYILLQHGGTSGGSNTVAIPSGDTVVQVSGYTGVWFGWNCVLQITLKTKNGKVFGPFGTMNNASSKTPFQFNAPTGQSIVAFSGSIVQVPLAGGSQTYIIASLGVSYA